MLETPSPSPFRQRLWIISLFFLITAVILGVLLFQEGAYLQTRLTNQPVVSTGETVSPDQLELMVDSYTKAEAHCLEEVGQQGGNGESVERCITDILDKR